MTNYLVYFQLLFVLLLRQDFESRRLGKFWKMDKVEYRAVIKYRTLKGLIPTHMHADMVETLVDNAPSFATVKRWAAGFKRGRESIEDDPMSGRPSTARASDAVSAKIFSSDFSSGFAIRPALASGIIQG